MFKLEIRTDNAAFGDDARGEIARILRHIATTLERHSDDEGRIFDHNGNHVGEWSAEDAA